MGGRVLAIEPVHRRRGARLRAGPVVVVTHEEDAIRPGSVRGGRHRGAAYAARGRDGHLGIGQPLTKCRPQAPDPCPVAGMRSAAELHIDVDAVEALLLGEVHELLDPAALRLFAAVELPVLRLAEARIHHFDAGSTLVGLTNRLLAEIPGDPPVAGLVVLHPAAAAWVTENSASVDRSVLARCLAMPASISQYGTNPYTSCPGIGGGAGAWLSRVSSPGGAGGFRNGA